MSFSNTHKNHWMIYFALIAAYILSGELLSSITSNNQVVPVWLPAGIALVGAYFWRWRFVPAIFFASIFFNLGSHNLTEISQFKPNIIKEVFFIATGASLQAMAGCYILHRWVKHPLELMSDRHAILFIVVVGILVNLISSNIGVYSLSLFNNQYSSVNHWNNVLYWWLGDSLGVLLGTPFILALLNIIRYSKTNNRSHLKPNYIILTTSGLLFISVTITSVFFNFANSNSATNLAHRESTVIENGLHRQFNKSIANIHSLSSFIQSEVEFSVSSFERFVAKRIKNQPSIHAMSWNPIIQADQIPDLEQKLFNHYGREIAVKGTPLDSNDHLVVVKLISPVKGNEAALGFNVYSNPDRKEILANPELESTPLATSIIQLVQSSQPEPAFLLFTPVFELDRKNKTREITGYATGVFLVQSMIERVFDQSHDKLFTYRFFEDDNTTPFIDTFNPKIINPSIFDTKQFEFAGRQWTLQLYLQPEFITQHQSQSAMLLYILQVIISAFVMLLILLMNNRQTILNSLVDQRTLQLSKAKTAADESNIAKSRFLANMSHELRTPLNAVIGFSQLAKGIKDPDILLNYFNKIEASSNNLVSIVNDILDISKIESNNLTLENVVFDAHEILNRLNTVFEQTANNDNISWSIKDELPLDQWYFGDPLRFEQILVNLCSNALKFSKNKSVLVHAMQVETSNNNVQIHVAVKDSGIGIPKEAQARLFDAFTQADTSTSRKYGGTGLGLSISKELSQLMQGDLTVESQEGKGSTFILSVQLQKTNQPPEPEQNVAYQDLSNLKVLVAEDNVVNQFVIKEMLNKLSISYSIADNGQEALDQLAKEKFDVVLMDCQMPVMDGYEATKIIKTKDYKATIVIALTANAMQEDKQKALACGFDDFLTKPLKINELNRCLGKYV